MGHTPVIDLQCGIGWNTWKVGRAMKERDELCPCGRMSENQEHEYWCPDEVERRAEKRNAIYHEIKDGYITLGDL